MSLRTGGNVFRVTTNPVYTNALADELLGALSARPAAALLITPTVHLRTDSVIPTPFGAASNYTEATFAGYGAATVSFSAAVPVNLLDGVRGLETDATFVAGAVTASQTVTGYWVDNGASTPAVTYMAENFADPIPIVRSGDFVGLDVIMAFHEIFETQAV